MQYSKLIKTCLLLSLICGEESIAIEKKESTEKCKWVGFDLEDSMDFEIIVKYTNCDGKPITTVPFGNKTTYPEKPDPFQALSNSKLTVYGSSDLSTPLRQVDMEDIKYPPLVIQCVGVPYQKCIVEHGL